jgi:hypothetical protein
MDAAAISIPSRFDDRRPAGQRSPAVFNTTTEHRRLHAGTKPMSSSAELSPIGSTSGSRIPRPDSVQDELTQLKRQLLQAEVRLAKGRATVSGSEADVKLLNSRLRALTK